MNIKLDITVGMWYSWDTIEVVYLPEGIVMASKPIITHEIRRLMAIADERMQDGKPFKRLIDKVNSRPVIKVESLSEIDEPKIEKPKVDTLALEAFNKTISPDRRLLIEGEKRNNMLVPGRIRKHTT